MKEILSNIDIASAIGGFVIGTVTGATGKYLADHFTDKRRARESKSEALRDFERIVEQMPDLVEALQIRLADVPLTRDILIRSNNQIAFPSRDGSQREGHQSNIDGLLTKLRVLENIGYVADTRGSSDPSGKYTMSEKFVQLLQQHRN